MQSQETSAPVNMPILSEEKICQLLKMLDGFQKSGVDKSSKQYRTVVQLLRAQDLRKYSLNADIKSPSVSSPIPHEPTAPIVDSTSSLSSLSDSAETDPNQLKHTTNPFATQQEINNNINGNNNNGVATNLSGGAPSFTTAQAQPFGMSPSFGISPQAVTMNQSPASFGLAPSSALPLRSPSISIPVQPPLNTVTLPINTSTAPFQMPPQQQQAPPSFINTTNNATTTNLNGNMNLKMNTNNGISNNMMTMNGNQPVSGANMLPFAPNVTTNTVNQGFHPTMKTDASVKPEQANTGPKIIANFTDPQIFQLKAQIAVFRRIVANQPIPEKYLLLSRGIFPDQQQLSQQPPQTQFMSGVHVAAPAPVQYPPQLPQQPTMHLTPQTNQLIMNSGAQNFSSPMRNDFINSRNTPQTKPATPRVRKLPLAVAPMDPQFLATERVKRLNKKFANRLNDITDRSNVTEEDEEAQRLQKMIEVEQIKLLGTQQLIRKMIVKNLRVLNTTQDRTGQRVRKKKNDRSRGSGNAQSTEKVFLNAILAHVKLFKDFHSGNQQKIKKINRSMTTYHTSKARKEQQHREKQEKERLKLLKENDEIGYLKLLEETKNERLTQLLAQTNDYLNQIGAKVREAKESTTGDDTQDDAAVKNVCQPTKSLNDMTEEEKQRLMEKEKEEAKQSQSTKTYYTIAHTIKEEITSQPDILTGGALKPYQITGLQWLVSLYNNNLNGVLADEMGLGKTIQTIALLTYLMEKKGCNGPFLIVVPLSVVYNWDSELFAWAPSIDVIVYKGSKQCRKDLFQNRIHPGKFNVVLTTFEFIMRDKSSLSKVNWNYIILDEGHRIKNASCKLTTILSKHYKSRHRLLLTGTPLQNSVPELWSLLNFLLPTIFNSVENFENWFSAPFAIAGERAEMTEEETLLIIHRLHKVLRPFLLRRLKQEVQDQLPEKVEKVLRCEFSAMQTSLYETMKEKGVVLCDPTKGKSASRGLKNTIMQLRKVCNHPYLFTPDQEYQLDENLIRASGKFVLLDRLLEKLKAGGHRVLIFSQMTALMSILGDMLQYRGYQYLRLDGSTKADDRAELLKQFNQPDSPYFIFILSTRAGGLGLNLQTADTVVIFDSDWNPQVDLQAQARAHRIGQKNTVSVFRLVTMNSIEESILDKANHKLDVDRKIIQAGMFNNSSNPAERTAYLMNLLKKGGEDEEEDLIPNDHQFNRLIARGDHEIPLFDEIDRQRAIREEQEWIKDGHTGPPPPRLMAKEELPDWLLEKNINEAIDEQELYGRGKRNRNEINYEYDETLDIFEDDVAEKRRKQSSPSRRRSRAPSSIVEIDDMDADQSFENDDDDDEMEDFKEEPVVTAPKPKSPKVRAPPPPTPAKSRRASAAPTTPTASAASTPTTGTKRKRAPPQKKTKVDDTASSQRKKQLLSILDAVRNCTDAHGRSRSYLFHKLPSKRDYPDYYQIIKKPIDFNTIEKRINSGQYSQIVQFHQDMKQLFTNATTYNMEGSQVYEDALAMKELCDNMVAGFEEDESVDSPPTKRRRRSSSRKSSP